MQSLVWFPLSGTLPHKFATNWKLSRSNLIPVNCHHLLLQLPLCCLKRGIFAKNVHKSNSIVLQKWTLFLWRGCFVIYYNYSLLFEQGFFSPKMCACLTMLSLKPNQTKQTKKNSLSVWGFFVRAGFLVSVQPKKVTRGMAGRQSLPTATPRKPTVNKAAALITDLTENG